MKHVLRFVVAFALSRDAPPSLARRDAAPMAAACAPARGVGDRRRRPMPASHRRAGHRGPRQLFGPGDLVIIGGGTRQRRAARPAVSSSGGRSLGGTGSSPRPHAVTTAGWLRIVAVDETTAIALVDFACDGVAGRRSPRAVRRAGRPARLPNRADAAGEPDFSSPGRLLFGDNERTSSAACGDFMVTDRRRGTTARRRDAVRHLPRRERARRAAGGVGEAIVVFG